MDNKTLEITKDIVLNIDFDDEILPLGDNLEKGTPANRLNFLLYATDDVYVWAGCYKDEKEAEEWGSDRGYYNIYINYDPVAKKPYLDTVGHDDVPNEDVVNVEIVGEGVGLLIEKMEAYCEDLLGESTAQVLIDYNEQFQKDLVAKVQETN